MNLSNNTTLITGASSGIGKAIAIKLSELGANVILLGRNKERLEDTLSKMYGKGHSYFSLDISEYNNLEEVIIKGVAQSGKINGFVHCAGIEKTLPFKKSNVSIFKEIFSVNVYAGFELARIISNKKYRKEKASFVFISSVMGILGESGATAYCASKAAIIGGVKAMAIELASKGIRCNSVLPGIVQTELIKNMFKSITLEAQNKLISKYPLGLGNPEDIAALVVFLISSESKWITGSEIVIDGGYSAS